MKKGVTKTEAVKNHVDLMYYESCRLEKKLMVVSRV